LLAKAALASLKRPRASAFAKATGDKSTGPTKREEKIFNAKAAKEEKKDRKEEENFGVRRLDAAFLQPGSTGWTS